MTEQTPDTTEDQAQPPEEFQEQWLFPQFDDEIAHHKTAHLTTETFLPGAAPAAPQDVDYALHLDQWGKRQGEFNLANSKVLQDLKLTKEDASDCFGAVFEPYPEINQDCANQAKKEFFEQLMQTPDFQEMHESTMLNDATSEIATCAIAQQLAVLIKDTQQPEGTHPEPGGNPSGKGSCKTKLNPSLQAAIAANKAATAANQGVNEANEMQKAFGHEKGQGAPVDTKTITKLFTTIRNDARLYEITKLAGRYIRVAASTQRKKAIHGLDEIIGIELGNDPSRLLPQELALLGVEELENDTLRRYVERQLMQRETKATEKVGKGPIVVCIDESGSMSGAKINNAKAISLAIGFIARKQNRWCCFVSWSSSGQVQATVMKPKQWDQQELVKWLKHFYNGGTDVPLAHLPRIFEKQQAPKAKTDIIMITDACCEIASNEIEKFNQWKVDQQVRMISLILEADAGPLQHVSDEVHLIKEISVDSHATEQVLSI